MQVCSTILFFGENPHGYQLRQTASGFELVPGAFTTTEELPRFSASRSESQWQIEGEADGDLKEQIQKLLAHQAAALNTPLQAAP